MEIRSFLAFELPPEIKSVVDRVSGELRKSTLPVKWVKAENMHLTVIFMGNTQMDDVPAIGEETRKISLGYAPFDISLKGIGSFPNRRNPRVLWLGLHGDLDRISDFRDTLQKHLKPFGVKEEKRRFSPHLTLGRFRRPQKGDFKSRPPPSRPPASQARALRAEGRVWEGALDHLFLKYSDLESPISSLKELVLFRSDLKPGGAEYTKLDVWPLTGKE